MKVVGKLRVVAGSDWNWKRMRRIRRKRRRSDVELSFRQQRRRQDKGRGGGRSDTLRHGVASHFTPQTSKSNELGDMGGHDLVSVLLLSLDITGITCHRTCVDFKQTHRRPSRFHAAFPSSCSPPPLCGRSMGWVSTTADCLPGTLPLHLSTLHDSRFRNSSKLPAGTASRLEAEYPKNDC